MHPIDLDYRKQYKSRPGHTGGRFEELQSPYLLRKNESLSKEKMTARKPPNIEYEKANTKSRVLNYYINDILRAPKISSKKFGTTLASKIIPIIHLLFSSKHNEWTAKEAENMKKRSELEIKIQDEIEETFKNLKIRLSKTKLLEIPSIRKHISSIIDTLKGREIAVMPPYYIRAQEKIQDLCEEILKLEHKELIDDYTVIGHRKEYVPSNKKTIIKAYCCCDCGYVYDDNSAQKNCESKPIPLDELGPEWSCPVCSNKSNNFKSHQKYIISKQPYIKRFTFAKSIYSLEELDEVFINNTIKQPVWMSNTYLSRVEWSLKVDRDFFRKKKLSHERKNAIRDRRKKFKALEQQDADRLYLHAFRASFIPFKKDRLTKNKEEEQGEKKNLINRHLDRIIEEVDLCDPDNKPSLSNETTFPYAIELKIEEEEYTASLIIEVEWEKGLIEKCLMHTFQQDPGPYSPNITCKFITSLLAQPGSRVEIENEFENKNAIKYLNDVQFKKELDTIFIVEKNCKGATLSCNRVVLSKKDKVNLKKLRSQIQKFKTIDWKFK